jgi:hypothetical protein
MKKYFSTFCLFGLLIFAVTNVHSQVTIKGPVCVKTGITYQYMVVGKWATSSTMNVCVSGGLIADSIGKSNCTPVGAPVSNILVRWSSPGIGSLQLASAAGNATLSVTISEALDAGRIDSGSKFQMVSYNTKPASISCGGSKGGHCSPAFIYQWQQSSDRVSWTDLPGNTGQDLLFVQPITQTTFYRRKVIEMGSNTIDYSDMAFILVIGLNAAVDSASVLSSMNL